MKSKEFSYNFTDGDIETLLFTLSLLPELRMEESEAQADINAQLSASAIGKLITGTNSFSLNEFRVITASLMVAKLILSDGISVDNKTMRLCQKYTLTINKLCQQFSPVLEE